MDNFINKLVDLRAYQMHESSLDNEKIMNGMKRVLSSFSPYVSRLIGIIDISIGVNEVLFMNKIKSFLSALQKGRVTDQEISSYSQSLGDKSTKVGNYLISYIQSSDNEDKATIIGYIFSEAIRNKIDYTMMLRLCSIVNRSFLPDLHYLNEYTTVSTLNTIESNSFINLGLIDNDRNGTWTNEPSYQLNDVGMILYRILKDNKWSV